MYNWSKFNWYFQVTSHSRRHDYVHALKKGGKCFVFMYRKLKCGSVNKPCDDSLYWMPWNWRKMFHFFRASNRLLFLGKSRGWHFIFGSLVLFLSSVIHSPGALVSVTALPRSCRKWKFDPNSFVSHPPVTLPRSEKNPLPL